MKKDTITITREQLLKSAAEVTGSKTIMPLIEEMPSLILIFGVFSSKLCEEMFDKEDKEEESEVTE